MSRSKQKILKILKNFSTLNGVFLQIECSNGQIGYGRRRRAISQSPADPNKVFEISLATFIKVNYEPGVDQRKY